MSTAASRFAKIRTSAVLHIPQTTGCESAFAATASKPDSLAELTRFAILIQGASFPGFDIVDVEDDGTGSSGTL